MKEPASKLLSSGKNAKSDVANKLISMYLHELSQAISASWKFKVNSSAYVDIVRGRFNNLCPYCSCELNDANSIIEHMDGMNRLRAGLHVPGNVVVACKSCNNEKRRDDSKMELTLAASGWESFLSHDGTRCTNVLCKTCLYWKRIRPDHAERKKLLGENLQRIRDFRNEFRESREDHHALLSTLPATLMELYIGGQAFAAQQVKLLLEKVHDPSASHF